STLAFLVIPERLRHAFEAEQAQMVPGASRFEQRVLAAFINEGHFERHIWRSRKVYARRRQALISALLPAFRKLSIPRSSNGTVLLIKLSTALEDEQCVALALRAGLPLLSTGAFSGGRRETAGEFVMPLGWIAEQEITDRVKVFIELVNEAQAQRLEAVAPL